ncbi:MAG TPA: hypothetical protein VHM02_15420, partial [Thermoanaerobaculia bacterium]|nr:hypothetical protein [Thermoanaerobaculia bacterium]
IAAGAGLAATGAFFALGAFNPIAAWLLTRPLLDVLRFPSKLWLLAAVGLSLLAGVGFERLFVRGEAAARRRALGTLGALGALLAGVWTALAVRPDAAARLFLLAMPESTPKWMAAAEVERWSGLALAALATAAALAATVVLARRRPRAAGALLVVLHAATQLGFLAPVRATDAALPYTLPSRLLEVLPAGEAIVHGAAQNLFGDGSLSDGTFPEPRAAWIFRRGFHELYPMGGGLWGRRYDLVTSPEALDPLPTRQAFAAVEHAPDDRRRLRLLAAWGAERLVLDRAIADADLTGLAEPVASAPSFRRRVWVYRLLDPAPPVHLATRTIPAASSRDASRRLASDGFRHGADAVVVTRGPGAPPAGTEIPGMVATEEEGPEREEIAVATGGAGAARPGRRPDVPSASARRPGSAASGMGAGASTASSPDHPPVATASPAVHVLAADAESLTADVSSPSGGLLVWRQAWLPIYRATVDGLPVPTLAANLHHLALPVPPGRHRVHLAPDRRPLHLALLAAGLGALTLLVLAAPRRRPATGRPRSPSRR